jgi:RNA polymerase sigma factor (sigma-70 family)
MQIEDLLTVYLNDANRSRLYRYALMLTGDHETASDLVADLALTIYSGEIPENVREPIAYFKTCMRHAYCNSVRRDRRFRELAPQLAEGDANRDTAQEDRETRALLRELLEGEPPEWIEAFEAFYLDGYSQKEIASGLGVSVNTVAQRFKRMRMRIRKDQTKLHQTLLMIFLLGRTLL